MPELPEVETIKRELENLICGKSIAEIDILDPKAIIYPSPLKFKEDISGREICFLRRRGKYLLFFLSEGLTLLSHLRMTGQLVYCHNYGCSAFERHTRLVFFFSDQSSLLFRDQRRLGGFWLLEEEQLASFPALALLGPDILEEVDAELFEAMLSLKGSRRIKLLMLDQKFVAGLGNIYTDEALFRARIHPERFVGSLSKKEKYELFNCIQKILQESLAKGGTSTSNYVNARGRAGEFQKLLQVYRRHGQPCRRCGHLVERIEVGGRGTYYCPRCQPR